MKVIFIQKLMALLKMNEMKLLLKMGILNSRENILINRVSEASKEQMETGRAAQEVRGTFVKV